MDLFRLFAFCTATLLAPYELLAQSAIREAAAYGTGSQVVGVSLEHAPFSGEVWGYTTNTRFSSISLQYSVVLTHGSRTRLRFAPELVPFATLLERRPSETNPAAPVRDYAAGARPVGFELEMRRGQRIQPLLRTKEGFLYYNRRVLSPGASQFMFTLDFGAGARFFASPQNSFDLTYRYQHESNANISMRNPGTDSHVIGIGFSHFSRR